jgi:hypothetical protein
MLISAPGGDLRGVERGQRDASLTGKFAGEDFPGYNHVKWENRLHRLPTIRRSTSGRSAMGLLFGPCAGEKTILVRITLRIRRGRTSGLWRNVNAERAEAVGSGQDSILWMGENPLDLLGRCNCPTSEHKPTISYTICPTRAKSRLYTIFERI